MALLSYVSYVVLCVYYVWRAAVLFTVESLLFLPRYFLIERHDTQSRWLGRRGEAQLQPLLPTAFQYEQANAEAEESGGGNSKNTSSSAAMPPPHNEGEPSTANMSIASSSLIAGVARCVLLRESIGRIRSLRSSTYALWGRAQQAYLLRPSSESMAPSSYVSDASLTSCEAYEGNESDVFLRDPLACVGDVSHSDAVSAKAAEEAPHNQSSSSVQAPRLAHSAVMKQGSPSTHKGRSCVTDAFFGGVEVYAEREMDEGAMRAAVPTWCTVKFQHHKGEHHEQQAYKEAAAVRIAGQYGFLPPWYAVYARTQLLLAHVDPLSRMVAELMCLRGWARAASQTDSNQVEGTSVEHPQSLSRGSRSLRFAPHALLASVCHGLICVIHMCCLATTRTLVGLLCILLQGAITLRSPTDNKESSEEAPSAGSAFRRLQSALHARVEHYVADTHHTFEPLEVTVLTMSKNDVSPSMPSSGDGGHGSQTCSSARAVATKLGQPKDKMHAECTADAQEAQGAASAPRPVTSCRRSLGVYWLHGRRPSPTGTEGVALAAAPSPPPLVILLVCPSLLNGSGRYPFAVTRISHICQLLSLAGAWQAPWEATGGDGHDEISGAAAPVRAQWCVAVPIVELSTPGSAPGEAETVSRAPLTLKDLRLVVHCLRRFEHVKHEELRAEPTAPSSTATRRVFLVAVGWSEAASPLLELAMTQQHQQQKAVSQPAHYDAAASARLDGLICLSHTLSSTFQLLPQKRDASLALMQPYQSGGLHFPSRSVHSTKDGRVDADVSGRSYTEGGGYTQADALSRLTDVNLYATLHTPCVLSHLTTGPARLLLLLARLQLTADNLSFQRHHQEYASVEVAPTPPAASARSLYLALLKFRDAHEQASAVQRGLDVPTLLWNHCQRQRLQQRKMQHGCSGPLYWSAYPSSCATSTSVLREVGGVTACTGAAAAGGEVLRRSATSPSAAQNAVASPTVYKNFSNANGGAAASAKLTLSQHGLRESPVMAGSTTTTTTAAAAAASPEHMMASSLTEEATAAFVHKTSFQSNVAAGEANDASLSPRGSSSYATLPTHFAPRHQLQVPQSQAPSLFHSLHGDHFHSPAEHLSVLPHLETLTDWEELMRSTAMTDMQEQKRREMVDATTAYLPNPLSINSPLALQTVVGASASGQERDVDGHVSGSNSDHKRSPRYKEKPKNRPKSCSNVSAEPDVVGMKSPLLPTTKAASRLSLLSPEPPAQSPRSIKGHMSTDDVVASCTLQCVTPATRQAALYPDGSSNPSNWRNLQQKRSKDLSEKSLAHSLEGSVPRISRLTVPRETELDAAIPQRRAEDVIAVADAFQRGSAFLCAIAPPNPLCSSLTSPVESSLNSLYRVRGEATIAPSSQHGTLGPQTQSSERSAGAIENSTGSELKEGSWVADATGYTRPGGQPDDDSDAESGVLKPKSPLITTVTAAFSPTPHPPSSPPPPPTSIPSVAPPLRFRAFNTQVAALVELRVRSAQHAALIQRIRIPTLFMHASDDPVAPLSTLPFSLLQANPWITTVLTRRGSHSIFIESVSDIWRRPYLVLEKEEMSTPNRRGSQGEQGEEDTPPSREAATNSSETIENRNSRSSDDANSDSYFDPRGEGEEAAALSTNKSAKTQATHWRLRVEGTTWMERLLFEYVEQVFLASAAATPAL
ncbi:hypothetical protein ABL78_2786 [Leptomonas seymouri]|uniref:Uncharacterized protein n=1 Tax=Leptomonas seymouri TaxID=5684 RepID=A0A0N0P6W9_LEPSE|nr:hypothetical protein ABL78_2786 [Leptomonas seymouri]|eukprot:KPI88099.1 hypothetical protein ABL78_2786 [Leptomonas seymouri]